MAGGATCGDTAVAVQTASKTCVARSRRSRGMAHRAISASKWHVNRCSNSWRHDREAGRRNRVFSRIGRAMALGAIGRRRGRTILVNQRIGRMHREVLVSCRNVGMACRARRCGRDWNVVGRHGRHTEIDRAAVALGAITRCRVVAVCH